MQLRKCCKCGINKPLDEFVRNPSKRSTDGYTWTCLECKPKNVNNPTREKVNRTIPSVKMCLVCGETKPIEMFVKSKNRVTYDGYTWTCLECNVDGIHISRLYTNRYPSTPYGRAVLKYEPLNSWFEGSEFHHLLYNDKYKIDTGLGIYIPKALHIKGHGRRHPLNQKLVNIAAAKWLIENADSDVIKDVAERLYFAYSRLPTPYFITYWYVELISDLKSNDSAGVNNIFNKC